MTITRYRGFSSVGVAGSDTRLSDMEIIKADLRNHLMIRPGEVPGRPGFGSYITESLAEPYDLTTREFLENEVRRVVDYDPRVELRRIQTWGDPDNHSVMVRAELRFVELGVTDFFELDLDIRDLQL